MDHTLHRRHWRVLCLAEGEGVLGVCRLMHERSGEAGLGEEAELPWERSGGEEGVAEIPGG
jgi:hypothetical protein